MAARTAHARWVGCLLLVDCTAPSRAPQPLSWAGVVPLRAWGEGNFMKEEAQNGECGGLFLLKNAGGVIQWLD